MSLFSPCCMSAASSWRSKTPTTKRTHARRGLHVVNKAIVLDPHHRAVLAWRNKLLETFDTTFIHSYTHITILAFTVDLE